MRLIHDETETMQPLADAFLDYAEDVLTHCDRLAQAWRDLPRHWQGHVAEPATDDIRAWLNQVEESSNMAKFLGQHAKQYVEQAAGVVPRSDE